MKEWKIIRNEEKLMNLRVILLNKLNNNEITALEYVEKSNGIISLY